MLMVVDAFASYEEKRIRYYNNPFIRKSLRKEIIIGSKSRTSVNWQNYKKQRNQCVKALKMQKYSNFKTIL